MNIAKLTTTACLLVLLLLLILTKPLALAQQSPADLAELSLEQLGSLEIYTAARHLQPVREAPSSVTVLTRDDIQQHGYRTLGEVLQSVRGFYVTYNRIYNSVGVRGFGRPGDFSTRVLVLIDGHRLNDNVYDQAMVGTELPLDLDLIQRIEIIRGPVSSLYGSNALFAVINIITRRGGDLQGLELSSDAGAFNSYSGRLTYGRNLKRWEFLVSGSANGTRGAKQLFYPEYNTPETNYGIASHADDEESASTVATASFANFTAQALYGTRQRAIPTGAYGTIFNSAGTRITDSHNYFDVRYNRTFADSWDLLARVFYDRYNYRGTYLYASDRDPAVIVPNRDFADGRWWGTELQVGKTVFHRHRLTLGGEYRNNLRQDQWNYNVNPYESLLDDHRSSFVGALYLQDEFTLNSFLVLNAGVRYDYYSAVRSSTDPRAALIFRPRKNAALKFIYGEAFRAPNVYERYYAVFPNAGNANLNSEKIRSLEVVWEQALSSHLWLTAAAFHNDLSSLITEEQDGDIITFRNLHHARSNGFELEVKTRFGASLDASASYSYQQTRDAATHQFLNNSPRNLAKFDITHALIPRTLFLSMEAQYRSRVLALSSAPISPFTVVNTTLLGRNIGKHLALSASAYNLFDRKYYDTGTGETLQPVIQQNGRTFRVKMTWNFGE